MFDRRCQGIRGHVARVRCHNRIERLESILRSTRASLAADARVIVVTESIFSMDGDHSPLAEIVELKEHHGAWLLLDEAHSTGVLGPQGRGLAGALGLAAPSPIPILPFIFSIGQEADAVETSARLQAHGVLLPAIRYFTVAKGSARLRFTVSAAHAPSHFSALASALPALGGQG